MPPEPPEANALRLRSNAPSIGLERSPGNASVPAGLWSAAEPAFVRDANAHM
jgi:hypothetical protein